MSLISISESVVRKLKKDPFYKIESHYSSRQFLTVIIARTFQAVRGIWLKLWMHSSTGIIFLGRKVVVDHAYAFTAGNSLIIEDSVYINALSKTGINLGSNVTIAKGSILICTGVISKIGQGIDIGDNSAVGALSFLGGQGGIKIGNDVIMGPHVKIFSENHNFKKTNLLIRKQGESRRGVCIGNDCWIGGGVTIVDGVTIGSGAVVAAGAVVTKDIPANSVSAGVPARVLKLRTEE